MLEFLQSSPIAAFIFCVPACWIFYKLFFWLASLGYGKNERINLPAKYYHIDNVTDRRQTDILLRLSSKLDQHYNGQRHDDNHATIIIHGSPSDLNRVDFNRASNAAFLIKENDPRARLWFTEPERLEEPLHTIGDSKRKYNIWNRK